MYKSTELQWTVAGSKRSNSVSLTHSYCIRDFLLGHMNTNRAKKFGMCESTVVNRNHSLQTKNELFIPWNKKSHDVRVLKWRPQNSYCFNSAFHWIILTWITLQSYTASNDNSQWASPKKLAFPPNTPPSFSAMHILSHPKNGMVVVAIIWLRSGPPLN